MDITTKQTLIFLCVRLAPQAALHVLLLQLAKHAKRDTDYHQPHAFSAQANVRNVAQEDVVLVRPEQLWLVLRALHALIPEMVDQLDA